MNPHSPETDQSAGLYAIMMMGRPASGKTTVADWLAKSLSIRHILVARYKRLPLEEKYTAKHSLREDLRDFSCQKGIEVALESLAAGEPVILDSSFHKRKRRQRVYQGLSEACPLLVTIYCLSTDIEETRRRIQRRVGHESEARHQASDFGIYEYLDRTFDEPLPGEKMDFSGHLACFEVDTFGRRLPVAPSADELERHSILAEIQESLQVMLAGTPAEA